MAAKYVDLEMVITVSFEDDGVTELVSQAVDAEITQQAIDEATISVLVSTIRDEK